ncbi:hypothetical protein AYO21_06251 [Fonsecaea monophora]|uniref:Uncharacterized protein n=1 Tax=Fonsecaea monophora TaxID=254056 RepID=A0A177F5X2_9EURO|nr:hypothetical protein AYO21_06251 [Fonsecaea monophora]OAG39607.1 hypothetical protein AYO21_06251 [Fonsecaea monophora]
MRLLRSAGNVESAHALDSALRRKAIITDPEHRPLNVVATSCLQGTFAPDKGNLVGSDVAGGDFSVANPTSPKTDWEGQEQEGICQSTKSGARKMWLAGWLRMPHIVATMNGSSMT